MSSSLFVSVPEACGRRNLSELLALKGKLNEAISATSPLFGRRALLDLRQNVNEVLDSLAAKEVEGLLTESEKALADGNIRWAKWLVDGQLGLTVRWHLEQALQRNRKFRERLNRLRQELGSRLPGRTTRPLRVLAGGLARAR